MDKVERKILKLKKKARAYYLDYQYALGTYSCGNNLARHISSSASRCATKFNETMDELAKLDKNVTKGMRL